MTERTLVIIKPDGIQRHLTGDIISRFEKKGFKLVAAKFLRMSEQQARVLYGVHKDRPFYEHLVEYIRAHPVFVMVWEAEGVIEMARKMAGATFGHEAEPGTIRGDLCCSRGYNLVHSSDSRETAGEEISLFFRREDLVEYELSNALWLYGRND